MGSHSMGSHSISYVHVTVHMPAFQRKALTSNVSPTRPEGAVSSHVLEGALAAGSAPQGK
jgi:hypothetical protein